MKVAVDISPLKSKHRVRGIGAYTQRLVAAFKEAKWPADFEFFDNPKFPPPADVVHYPYFDLFYRSLPLKKTGRRVVTIHDVIPLVFPNYFPSGPRGYINLFFQRRALKNTQAIICDSQTSKNDIVEKLSYPQNKIHVVYLAPDANFQKIKDTRILKVVAQKYHLPKRFVLYVGDVNWHKNLNNLLHAVSLAKVHLVMVGQAHVDRDLAQTKEINVLTRKLGLEDKIIKTGYVAEDDLVVLYNLAALTILPSFYEGFGLPVIESLACGTPVVCSNVASLSEISGDVTIYCNPQDPQDIATKITKVLNLSAKELETLSLKSQNHAAKFTWRKVAAQTIKVYRQVYKG